MSESVEVSVKVSVSGGVKHQSWSVIIMFVTWWFGRGRFCSVCPSKPVSVIAVCLFSRQTLDAFVSAELTSLHDVTLP